LVDQASPNDPKNPKENTEHQEQGIKTGNGIQLGGEGAGRIVARRGGETRRSKYGVAVVGAVGNQPFGTETN